MKSLPLLLPLLCSCAFFEAAVKPASVATAGAGGALLGGPAGAAVAAGGVSAAWDIADAEEEVAELKESREETFWRMYAGASQETKDTIAATTAADIEKERQQRLRDLEDQKGWVEKLVHSVVVFIAWVAAAVLLTLFIAYLLKQKRSLRRLHEFGDRLLEKARNGD